MDNKCFQYARTVALNHKKIKGHHERITKVKPFIFNYDWKKFEKNNLTIALNVLYAKNEKIYPAYVSRHNLKREKQIILLMIPEGERWRKII